MGVTVRVFKFFAILSFFFIYLGFSVSFAGTCTTLERPNGNYTAGQTLTANQLNSDFNGVYNKVNSLDGGCLEDGSLEPLAFNSDMAALKDQFKGNCEVYWDGSDFKIDSCQLAVNGRFVNKTSATTFDFDLNCSGCSVAAAGSFYVYVLDGSTGGTLNLRISSTAPTYASGYDNSSNRAIARFVYLTTYGVDKLSIEQYSQDGQWYYVDRNNGNFESCLNVPNSWTTNTTLSVCKERREGRFLHSLVLLSLTGAPESEPLTFTMPRLAVAEVGFGSLLANGRCEILDNSASKTYEAHLTISSTTVYAEYFLVDTSLLKTLPVSEVAPITFAANDSVKCDFFVPVYLWR